MPAITDLLDSDMEKTTNFIDENSLISSVSDDTLGVAPAKLMPKPARKRKCVTLTRKPRSKATAKQDIEIDTKTGAKGKVNLEETEENEDHAENAIAEAEAPKPSGRARKVAKAKTSQTEASEIVETEPPKPQGRATKASSRATKTTSKAAKKPIIHQDALEEDIVPSPVNLRSDFAPVRTMRMVPKPISDNKSKPTKRAVAKSSSKALEETISDEEADQDDHELQAPPRKRMRPDTGARQEPSYRRRGGSVSDTERGDPMLRRKLGDVTRKYENMEMKYRNLKDTGITEASNNVEKLRKQCEAITEASNQLVASLKKELAQQAPIVQESKRLKKEAQNYEFEAAKLRVANTDLSTTLTAAQTEIKVLQAKVAAMRATPAPQPEIKKPASSTKTNGISKYTVPPPNQSENEKEAQLKIDLYSDLTGLIVRSAKQTEDGDTYDCIQTGKNGTLHFKLFVDSENAKKVGFEETEFLYTPLLDANRDRDLMTIMPDYLTEDITFVREVAAKFYARVIKTLTEKPIETEED